MKGVRSGWSRQTCQLHSIMATPSPFCLIKHVTMVLKIFEMIATSGFLTALECTKFVFDRRCVREWWAAPYANSWITAELYIVYVGRLVRIELVGELPHGFSNSPPLWITMHRDSDRTKWSIVHKLPAETVWRRARHSRRPRAANSQWSWRAPVLVSVVKSPRDLARYSEHASAFPRQKCAARHLKYAVDNNQWRIQKFWSGRQCQMHLMNYSHFIREKATYWKKYDTHRWVAPPPLPWICHWQQ